MLKLSLFQKLKSLGIDGFFRLFFDLVYTKLKFKEAMLIRRPAYIRNIGWLSCGAGFSAGPGLIIDILEPNAKLTIGRNVKINHRCHIGVTESVLIGDNVLIASNVYISDHSHGNYSNLEQDPPEIPPNTRKIVSMPVVVQRNVWLGENVCVLPGVIIGEGSIIGAGSVVNRSIPPFSIAVGSPAKVVKIWNESLKRWERV